MTEDLIDMAGVLHLSHNDITFGQEKFKGCVEDLIKAKVVFTFR